MPERIVIGTPKPINLELLTEEMHAELGAVLVRVLEHRGTVVVEVVAEPGPLRHRAEKVLKRHSAAGQTARQAWEAQALARVSELDRKFTAEALLQAASFSAKSPEVGDLVQWVCLRLALSGALGLDQGDPRLLGKR